MLVFQNIYVPYLIMAQFIVFAGYTIESFEFNKFHGFIYKLPILLFYIVGFSFINSRVVPIYHYVYIAIGISIFTLTIMGMEFTKINKFLRRITKNKLYASTFLIIFDILFFSFFIVDFSNRYTYQDQYYPFPTITEEEKEIIDFIRTFESGGVLDSFSRYMGARIALYSDWFHLADPHSITLIEIGTYNKSEIIQNSTLKEPWYWAELYIYNCSFASGEKLHSELVNLSANSPKALEIIRMTNLTFFISYKNESVAQTFSSSYIVSPFVITLPSIAHIAFETKNYYVWRINL